MQLPRGTFREIQKKQRIGDVLSELERGRFTGICSISYRDKLGTLVLKAGKCILAEFDTFKGDAALENLIYTMNEGDIDAALSTLDEAQIQLSLEFNRAEKIVKTGQTSPAARKNPPVVTRQQHHHPETWSAPVREPAQMPQREKPPAFPHQLPKMTDRPLAGPKNSVHEPPAALKAGPVPKAKTIPEKETEPTESDIDTLDSMNLDEVTEKIRDDCKTMVKNLHLDHLMDRD